MWPVRQYSTGYSSILLPFSYRNDLLLRMRVLLTFVRLVFE